MLKNLRKLVRDEEGAVALEYGLVAVLLAAGLFTVLSDNSDQEAEDKRGRVIQQISHWVKGIRGTYGPYSVTDDSATVSGIIDQKDLPADTVIDYANDGFRHALGNTIDPVLNGDSTFGLALTFLAEDCKWVVGRMKSQLEDSRIASVSVNGTAVATISRTTTSSACNAASNVVLLTYNL